MGQKRDFRILRSRILKARKAKSEARKAKKHCNLIDCKTNTLSLNALRSALETLYEASLALMDEESKLINVGWRFFAFDSHRKDLNAFKRVDVYDRWFNLVYAYCKLDSVDEHSFSITTFENEFKRELSNDLYYIKKHQEY